MREQALLSAARTDHLARMRPGPEMNVKLRWRNFLLLVVVAAVSPAWGQAASPTAAPVDGVKQTASSIPDFSGVWYRWLRPGFGPPSSGPGPVTNRSRLNGVANYNQLVGDYTNPILNAEAAKVVKEHGDQSLTGIGYPTPSNQCWPEGVPYIFWQYGMQMLQQPDRITMLYLQDHQVRHIRLNASHPAHVAPSWYGDSVGHYEGDTLVIDTVGIKSGPFSMVDMYGTPFTKALHVVERYRVLDYEAGRDGFERDAKINQRYPPNINPIDFDPNYRGKLLQLQFTVEDEGVFTTPWSGVITYGRPLGEWAENVCAENMKKYNTEKEPAVPTADRPDF
jgi:hypothetical protein